MSMVAAHSHIITSALLPPLLKDTLSLLLRRAIQPGREIKGVQTERSPPGMLEGTLVLNWASALRENRCLIVVFVTFCLSISLLHLLSPLSANDSCSPSLGRSPLRGAPNLCFQQLFSLTFPLPYITWRKPQHGENNSKRMLVESLASNSSSPRESFFFFFASHSSSLV